jgi:hypothetical protein
MAKKKAKTAAEKKIEAEKKAAKVAAKKKAAEAKEAQKKAKAAEKAEAKRIEAENKRIAKEVAGKKEPSSDASDKNTNISVEEQKAQAETAAAKAKEQKEKEKAEKFAAKEKITKAVSAGSLVIEPSDPYFAGVMRTIAKLDSDGEVTLTNNRIVLEFDNPITLPVVKNYLDRSVGDTEHHGLMKAILEKIEPPKKSK